ncbi:MAG: DUF354 domain-containing protein [Syntrophaceae bacterium]|nr:DUF354 domain-containing protein [Syntrophaceae bacterium]
MNKTIHFFAQDEGSVKALLPVYDLCSSRAGMKTRFYSAKYGLKFLERRCIACCEFPGTEPYPVGNEPPDLIVAGASPWDSIEKQAIAHGRAHGIPSLVIVDHGSNFWRRFTVTGERNCSALPDVILAPDEESRDSMCHDGFPPGLIIVTGNPYFDAFQPAAGGRAAPHKPVILCIMQPDYTGGRYCSDASWLTIIQGLAEEFASRASVIVRPHHKEDNEFYRPLAQMGVNVDNSSDITDLIITSDVVIGKNSTSLIEAVFRGKVVISLGCGESQFERLPTERMGLSADARSVNELREWIGKSLLQAPVPRKLKKIRYYNDGRNTERAAACLLRMLEMERPASKGGETALPGRIANG